MTRDSHVAQYDDRIDFVGRYRPENVVEVCRFFSRYMLAKPERIILNFSSCVEAFPNSMLPLVALCSRLRPLGYSFYTFLPKAVELQQRFRDNNWAHYLSP